MVCVLADELAFAIQVAFRWYHCTSKLLLASTTVRSPPSSLGRVKLSRVEEEGVMFANPYDPTKTSLLTPERSMQIQHSIGADIMM